ncbi:MAG: DUF177 domain-containing protein [Alphaproteobacteria bacterium]|nr:DUF177 domain-containing protein [Alphaproteobacteria bacterium]MBU0858416.1 DUF177 domain-containing protein [Alphaproteobacteria bacterium]
MDTDSKPPLRPEWSHGMAVDQIGHRPYKVTLTASPQERKDLARRLRVTAIEDLTATITAEREAGSMIIHVEGQVKGHVIQACVTTGQPVHEDITEDFEGWYADPTQAVPFVKARREKLNKGERELEVLPERDDPDLVVDGHIDVAELATQYLSLGINPYPRAGDIPPVGLDEPLQVAGPARKNPFAALKDWKSRQNGESGGEK